MDPDAALEAYREAIAASNYAEAFDYLKAVNDWMAQGGFPPAAIDRRIMQLLVFHAMLHCQNECV